MQQILSTLKLNKAGVWRVAAFRVWYFMKDVLRDGSDVFVSAYNLNLTLQKESFPGGNDITDGSNSPVAIADQYLSDWWQDPQVLSVGLIGEPK